MVRRPGSSLDYVEGALGGVTEAAVRFTLLDGEAMDVPLERLEGWTYYAPQNQPLSTPVCRIKDTIGNLWNAAQVELSNDAVQIQTVAGVRHKLSADQLVVIDFASGNVIFLSDLQPLKLQCTAADLARCVRLAGQIVSAGAATAVWEAESCIAVSHSPTERSANSA